MARRQKGLALITVIFVLVALVLIATTYMMIQQDQEQRSQDRWAEQVAEFEVQSTLQLTTSMLQKGTESAEREAQRRGAGGIHNTPDYDTLAELEVWKSALGPSDPYGVIRDYEVEDEQAKINVNTASPLLLGNLFGVSFVSEDVEPEDTEIAVEDATRFDPDGGMIRIGRELVRYERVEGNTFYGCERSVAAAGDEATDEAQAYKPGQPVINEVAIRILAHRFLKGQAARAALLEEEEGATTSWSEHDEVDQQRRLAASALADYTTLNALKDVAADGVVRISNRALDRVRPILTVFSQTGTAEGWANAQTLRNSLPNPGRDGGDVLNLDNTRYFGVGTLVRVSDGTNTDYGIVTRNNGRSIQLDGTVEHSYDIDTARVQMLVRHPVNVNTASKDALVAVLSNVALKRRVKDRVTPAQAGELADRILEARAKDAPFRSLKDWSDFLLEAEKNGLITAYGREALYRNALNPCDDLLALSTVPLGFRSFDVYTITARVIVNSRSGNELARRAVKQVVAVQPHRSTVIALETQKDFEEQIIATRDAKYLTTYPRNVSQTDSRNPNHVPPSRYVQHVLRNIWPLDGEAPSQEAVRFQPARVDHNAMFHFDDSPYEEGYYIDSSAWRVSTGDSKVGLLDTNGMKPFRIGFWYKPFWSGGTQTLFDSGEEAYRDRITLFYDGDAREIVFRVADHALEKDAVEVRYPVDASRFSEKKWYHFTVQASDTSPTGLVLLVDGEKRGVPTHFSQLAGSLGADATTIALESTEGFPRKGALSILSNGKQEIVEYDGISGSSVTVTQRGARGTPKLQHEAGASVMVYGFATPLMRDLKLGGSTCDAKGVYTMLRIVDQRDEIPMIVPDATGGSLNDGSSGDAAGDAAGASAGDTAVETAGDTTGDATGDAGSGDSVGGPSGEVGGADGASGGNRTIIVKGILDTRTSVTNLEVEAWDPGMSRETALEAFDSSGFALLCTNEPVEAIQALNPIKIGGCEVVFYRKNGTTIDITRYQTTAHWDTADPFAIPAHTYGDDPNGGTPGWFSALIPISLKGNGGDWDYIDPSIAEDLITKVAAVQIDDEWIRYDSIDDEHETGAIFFLRDANLDDITQYFNDDMSVPDGSTDGDSTDGDSGDGEVPGDVPPDEPPPDDDTPPPGDDEPPPPDDDTGGGDLPPPVDEPPPGDDEPPAPPDDDSGGDDGPPPVDEPPPADDEPPAPPDDDMGGGDDLPPQPDDPPPVDDDPPGPPDDDAGGNDEDPPLPDEPPPVDTDPPAPDDDSGGDTDLPPPDEPPLPGDDDDTTPPDDGGDTGDDTGGDDGTVDEDPGPADEHDGDRPVEGGDLGDGSDVPFGSDVVYRQLGFRGVAGTSIHDSQPGAEDGISADHAAGTEIIPCFRICRGLGRPGRSDRVTLTTAGGGQEEERRINYGYYGGGKIPADIPAGFVALTVESESAYEYDSNRRSELERANNVEEHLQWFTKIDTREFTRLIKFPSGEMPSVVASRVSFGQGLESAGVGQAFLDEVRFVTDLTVEKYFLFDPGMLQEDESSPTGFSIPGVDAEAEEIPIRRFVRPEGLPITGLPENGGVVKIDDELIAYREIDSGGYLLGCERGILGTEAKAHTVPSRIVPMTGIIVTRLEQDLTASAAELRVADAEQFPKAGYVRIGDEIIGYTKRTDRSLTMPARHTAADPAITRTNDPFASDTNSTSGLFRGRFGTIATEHPGDAIVYLMPFRYWDRYARFADDGEMSYFEVKKHVPGAVWKRVSWDEFLVPNVDIFLLVRFDGGPNWDSDRVVEFYEDRSEQVVPAEDPTSWLYLIRNPRMLNMLNVKSDRIEVRVLFPFQPGAYDRQADPMPDEWKDTPRLKGLKIEYVAPMTVLSHEEIR